MFLTNEMKVSEQSGSLECLGELLEHPAMRWWWWRQWFGTIYDARMDKALSIDSWLMDNVVLGFHGQFGSGDKLKFDSQWEYETTFIDWERWNSADWIPIVESIHASGAKCHALTYSRGARILLDGLARCGKSELLSSVVLYEAEPPETEEYEGNKLVIWNDHGRGTGWIGRLFGMRTKINNSWCNMSRAGSSTVCDVWGNGDARKLGPEWTGGRGDHTKRVSDPETGERLGHGWDVSLNDRIITWLLKRSRI